MWFPLYGGKEKSCIVNEHHAGILESGVKVTHIPNPGSRFMQLTSFVFGLLCYQRKKPQCLWDRKLGGVQICYE